MSEDVASRLRALARDHAEERLNLTSYRRLRAPLLDSLSARASGGEDPEVVTQPRAAALASRAADRTPAATGATPAPPGGPRAVAPAATRFGKGALTAGLVLLGAVLAIGVWLAWVKPHQAPGATVANAQGGAPESDSDPLRAELDAVLDNDDWSSGRLIRVNTALVEAGPQRIHGLAGTPWLERFTEAVRQRVKEQQALGAPLTPDKSPLAALAATIGIEVTAPAESQRAQSLPAGGAPVASRPAGQATGPAQAGAPSSPPIPANAQAASVAVPAAAPSSGPRAGPPAAATAVSPVAPNAATSPSAGAAPQGQSAGCNRRFCQDRLTSGEPGIRMAVIPQGSYAMGNANVPGEGPAHQVAIRQSFAISAEEVSQAEYRWYCVKTGKTCPAQPSWAGDDYPVVNVSWNDATEYARWMSQMTGKRYRLPTEAEWEYAARAGQTGLFPQGSDSLNPVDAYFSDKTKLAAPAARSQNNDFNPNPWHLYHMIGNVREWVQDAWAANFDGAPSDGSARDKAGAMQRVVRGGSYADGRAKLRLTTREGLNADTRDGVTGIRLVRELP